MVADTLFRFQIQKTCERFGFHISNCKNPLYSQFNIGGFKVKNPGLRFVKITECIVYRY